MVSTRAEASRPAPAGLVGFFLAYVLTAAWAHEFAVVPGAELSLFYPPAGIALAVLFFKGIRYWPAAVAAEFVVGWWVYGVAEAFGPGRLVLDAVLVTGAYLLGALALRAADFSPDVAQKRSLAVFILVTFLLSAPAAAIAGTAIARWAGRTDLDVGESMIAWWLGDAIGMLVLAPVLLLAAAVAAEAPLGVALRRGLHRLDPLAVAQGVAVVAVPAITFLTADDPYRFLYVPLLPVVLVAAKRGAGPAIVAVLAATVSLTVAASRTDGGTTGRYELQLLLLVLAVTGQALGIVESLRRRAVERQEELAALVEASPDVVAVVDAAGEVVWANPAARRLLDLGEPGPTSKARLPGGLDEGAVAMALERGMWRGSAKVDRPDADALRLSQVLVAIPRPSGVSHVGVVARDVTDLHRVADQLTRMAFVDPLTGLANRARLTERLAYALAPADQTRCHGVALLDIDRFGMVNDRLGREAADRILRLVGQRLRENVRGGELLVRMGEDSFAVLLEDIPDTFSAVAVAERLRAAACGPAADDLGHVMVTVSAGVVVGETAEDPETVLRRADLALQRAKQAGGGSTVPYDPALSERLDRRIAIETRLRSALSGDGWPLRYQPLVDLRTSAVVSCEALIEPLAPPLEVIDVAEELGLIVPFGAQILEQAVHQAVQWRRRLPDLRMSVNVSAHQLLDPEFPNLVDRVLRRAGLPTEALVLEITETAFTDDRIEAIIAATLIQGMGVRLSIDDFGTGFSSLGRLRSLPVDELKIDRAFVADLGQQPGAEAIIAAVVALGAARDLDVVAEGIEEPAQLEILRSVGCGYGQGWHFARPMGPVAFDAWLDQRDASGSTRTPTG